MHRARPITCLAIRTPCQTDWPSVSRLTILAGATGSTHTGRIYDCTASLRPSLLITRSTTGRSPYTRVRQPRCLNLRRPPLQTGQPMFHGCITTRLTTAAIDRIAPASTRQSLTRGELDCIRLLAKSKVTAPRRSQIGHEMCAPRAVATIPTNTEAPRHAALARCKVRDLRAAGEYASVMTAPFLSLSA